MESIYKIWINLWSDLSWPFTVTILILAAWDLTTHYKNQGRDHKKLNGLMTGVGILGTFVGVVVGLQDFNTKDISSSIEPLLEGLKVSFATSVAGLFAAITTEITESLWPSKRAKIGDPVVDTLNGHMIEMADVLSGAKDANERVADNVAAMRTEMKDESQAVRDALENTLEELSKGATEEIIQALEGVIKDFNDNLTEQFGENFKQLNEACLKLVQWQQEYENSIIKSTESLNSAQGAMLDCKEQFEAAVPKQQEFHAVIKDTGLSVKALALLNDRLERLSEQQKETMEQLALVMDRINSRVEEVSENFNGIATEFTNINTSAKQTTDSLEKMLTEHARGHDEVSSNIDEVIKKLSSGNSELQRHLDEALKNLESNLSSLTQDFGRSYRTFLEALREINNQLSSQ